MAHSLRHRGPDSEGHWSSPRVIIGTTRLRIIDPCSRSDQPFEGPDKTVVACNGEIYNFGEIRRRFPTYPYRSRGDVESLVPLLAHDGIDGLTTLDGMFAIAVWNNSNRMLWLVRDRAGEKPLFYRRQGNEVWFASEIQALRHHPEFDADMDTAALADYLAFGYVREPKTLHKEVRKVPAGHIIEFSDAGISTRALDVPAAIPNTAQSTHPSRLKSLLEVAVTKQLQADVPVGVFMSGGLDSSLVTAFATRRRPGLPSFTVRFPESTYDEGFFAREVAAHFRTQHHEVLATRARLRDALDIATSKIAEPMADPATLPTILLSAAAREHVGVVLSGEGSDEQFGGYPTYLGHRWASLFSHMPSWANHLARSLMAHAAASGNRVPTTMLLTRFLQHCNQDVARRHVNWFGTGLFEFLPPEFQAAILDLSPESSDPVLASMQLDFSGYLREGLLPKLDRASMLSSLETRAPFLDRDVIRHASSLHRTEKLSGIRLKVALSSAARGIVPGRVLRRRKRGLSVPVGQWVNDELRSTVDALLDPGRIAKQSLLSELPVGRLLTEHRNGSANHSRALWPLIVYQLWSEKWEEKRTV